MAKEKTEVPRILPVPEPALRHHGAALTAALREWRASSRIPPVLLITGPSGVGKRTIAHYLAQCILCPRMGFSRGEPAEDDLFGGGSSASELLDAPCGECVSCQRALHNTWIDFAEIVPEEESDVLKVDQFRKLKTQLGFGAHEGDYKLTLVPDADRMTPQAANSVLKLLEEPPRGWLFILTAADPALVLPTVLSRCQRMRLKPFAPGTIVELLAVNGVDPARRALCAGLAGGSWGRALALAQDESWERRKAIFEFVREPGPQLNSLVDWASADPRNFDLLLDQLEQVCADLVRWTVSDASPETHAWLNSDGARVLAAHAKTRGIQSREFWLARAERVARARQESLAPLNRKLLAQDILMPWLGAHG